MEQYAPSFPLRHQTIKKKKNRGFCRGIAQTIALLTGVLGLALSSCSRKPVDGVINVEDNDQEMNAAIDKARASLPAFWQAFDERKRGESEFSLKVRIKDNHGTEHFWAKDIARKDGKIFGTINNDPEIVKNVKLGDRIPIPEDEISDWLYLREDKMVGNYTLRVLFKHMPAAEVENYKQRLTDP
jgi:uncharacterized protein YegJ (DUF2314 family)